MGSGVDYISLEFVAKVTIFVSVFTVIYLCGYVGWRISRFPNPVSYSPTEILKKRVEFPFKVKLLEESKLRQNVVNIHLTCFRNSVVKLIWGVEINYLAKLMNSPWRSLEAIMSEMVPGQSHENSNAYLAATDLDIKIKDDDSSNLPDSTVFDDSVVIKPPRSLKWEDLINKYVYPLVIAILPPISSCNPQEFSDESVGSRIDGLFVILHIKNETFNVPTTVLAEYVKMNSGHIFKLKPLFVVEDGLQNDEEDLPNPSSPNEAEEAFSGILCSVCQNLPISRAILPCRHVCLCAFCFDKVERCPICRGQLQYYFRTRSESYMSDAPSVVPLTKHLTWSQYFSVMSERLNQFLGFN